MASKHLIICIDCRRERKHGAHGRCDSCNAREWAKANPEKRRKQAREGAQRRRAANPEKFRKNDRKKYIKRASEQRAYQQHIRETSWAKRRWMGSSKNWRDRRANLTVAFLEGLQSQTPRCLCCNCELDYSYRKRGAVPQNYATLDKIIPKVGYTENNVAIICVICNRLKDRMTLDEARMIVNYIERHTSKKQAA